MIGNRKVAVLYSHRDVVRKQSGNVRLSGFQHPLNRPCCVSEWNRFQQSRQRPFIAKASNNNSFMPGNIHVCIFPASYCCLRFK